MAHPAGEWMTDSALKNLRLWWPDLSISTAEIGRRLGVTQNAIVGKAHRLGLERRPSPIIRTGPPKPPPAPQVTLPPLPASSLSATAAFKPVPREVFAPPPREVAILEPRHTGKVEPCCWVTTEGGKGKP
jgi:GcrA cell cycle regulator